jgi:hypothetical protein
MAHEPVHTYKQEERVPMSYSPLRKGTAQYMQLPLQYQQDSEPVFPTAQFISTPPQFSTLPGLHVMDPLIPQAATSWAS